MKATFFFELGTGKAGWSETWYSNDGTQQALLTKADQTLRPARLGVLAANYYLRQIRVSDETTPQRDSQVQAYSAAAGQGTANVANADPGDWGSGPEAFQPATALLVRTEGGVNYRRMFLLRGLPLGAFGADLQYNPSAAWVGLWNIFSTAYAGNGLQIKTRTLGAPQLPTAITIVGGGLFPQITFPGNAPAGMVSGALVQLTGWTGAAYLNGTWRIAVVAQPGGAGTASTLTMYPKRRTIVGAATNLGFVKLITLGTSAITKLIPLRGAKRNTGRPFGLPVGRRRVRQA